MILLLQLLFSVLLTAIYAIFGISVWNVGSIFFLILIFIGSFLLYLILLFLVYLVIIFTGENKNYDHLAKHKMYSALASYVFLFALRVKMVVTGKENLPSNNHFVIVSNHIELSDPIYMKIAYHNYPVAFVAKEPLFRTPLVANVLRGVGCIPIGKDADKAALQSILDSIKKVKNGQPMGIFPEGRRTYSNKMTEFKPGAFKLPLKAKADISPIVVYNMHTALKKGRIKRHTVYMHILPIIPYETYKEMNTVELSNLVYKQIDTQLDKFRLQVPSDNDEDLA